MKKYVLFVYWSYEASGGILDLYCSFDTLDELDRVVRTLDPQQYYHIIDRDTWETVQHQGNYEI